MLQIFKINSIGISCRRTNQHCPNHWPLTASTIISISRGPIDQKAMDNEFVFPPRVMSALKPDGRLTAV